MGQNFIVSARKYRPISFDEMVGQKSIVNTLEDAIKNDQLAHSYLFCGPRGVGKTSCARIFAKEINQFNNDNYGEDFSYNIFELDAASNNSVDDIRNLTEQVRVPPQIGKYKVYIIDEVHMLSSQAFNAFLKTLEEPPTHAKFILATTEKHKIIPTIMSRCQIFDFKRVGINDIVNHLLFVSEKENISSENEALVLIAEKSDGSVRDALSLFDRLVSYSENILTYKQVLEDLNILDHEYYFKTVVFCLKQDVSSLFLILNEVISNGFESISFINGLAQHFRNLLLANNDETIFLLEVSQNIEKMYQEQAKLCTSDFLFNAIELCSECDYKYNTTENKRLLVELCLIQISSLVKTFNAEKKNYQTLDINVNLEKSKIKNIKTSNHHVKDEKFTKKDVMEKVGLNKDVEIKEEKKRRTISINKTHDIESVEKKKIINKNPLKNNPIDKNQFQNIWKEIIDILKKEGKINLAIALGAFQPKINQESEINILLENSAQNELIKEEKINILNLLKERLHNDYIVIKTNISNNNEVSKPYTNKDKFLKMIKENSHLQNLQNKLSLDPEY